MGDISLIGIDLGKHSFHLHAQDSSGHMVFRKKLTRSQLLAQLGNFQACTVAMESCAGAHWLARRLAATGHQPKLIPPQFVKPFVKGNKSDFADAEAICEAAVRPNMHFAAPRTEAQQALSALHRVREALVGDHTCTTNQIHAFLLEFGISLAKGEEAIKAVPVLLARHEDLPPAIVDVLLRLQAHHKYLDGQIADVDREIKRQLKADERSSRLLEIPGVGPVTASALSIELGDPHRFKNARQFAASLGLVTRAVQHRRQAEAPGHQQARRQEVALASCAGCTEPHEAHRAANRRHWALGLRHARAPTFQRGGLRAGQQARQDRMGNAGQGIAL